MMKTVLLIEPFYAGSHKQLIDLLNEEFRSSTDLYTLPGKKWHWRARTSALHFSQALPTQHDFRVLFASSVLNLAELIALRGDLTKLHKVLYFHENQLLYPVEKRQERDFQYGYNQIISCLVADEIVFNSRFNQESFLHALSTYFTIMPKPRPKDLESKIRPKCRVLYYPLTSMALNERLNGLLEGDEWNNLSESQCTSLSKNKDSSDVLDDLTPLHIVWPHRWEHDKNPEEFFEVLYCLKEQHSFRLSVIGESYSEIPDVFSKAKVALKENIDNWGYRETREEYLRVLASADVVVSTAKQEFFGVAMLEAIQHRCYPLCPNRLVYPEIYPGMYIKIEFQ
ncbi:glycosyltransferase-like domain-containing protein 1 isoform X1 [Centruroides sculpturatus]|uniref:glycosyltransferase-like domain-containing protein 1 isoform X1 n=1 Tax=Centruroides sculpturatus TaxID=218467 RepID=UPI000C6EBB0C|nr:glycosyltransferase-like domain-containing protein 1 isoform X1 [Centruroides sculpturatus]XP_023228450.1 glycosyltransferase-like domain-containing protein 1 isoform X1 [Centruroides sculpturatus]XP_023228452.1 glycosyltransferase-like domain-containing protein 1 isoform X1 [Centruroides sculpturatus]